jgi:hypothetical protein
VALEVTAPSVPVTAIWYVPGGVEPEVVTVSEGVEDADSEIGLTPHTGRSEVTWLDVTVQDKLTAPVKPDPVVRVRIEVAEPPGSTDDG